VQQEPQAQPEQEPRVVLDQRALLEVQVVLQAPQDQQDQRALRVYLELLQVKALQALQEQQVLQVLVPRVQLV
jgi:hypothetical protein